MPCSMSRRAGAGHSKNQPGHTGQYGRGHEAASLFLNKFKNLVFIPYNRKIEVHSSLLDMVLHD